MKSIKEIEERIGFSLEYDKWTEYVRPNDWNNFMGDSVEHRRLNQRSKEAIENLLVESLNVGDMETASVCGRILSEASLDKQEREELRSAENEQVEQILVNIDSLDENASIEDIKELLESIKLSESACSHIDDETKKRIEDKRQGLSSILQQKVKDKITSLDEQIAELQEHIEIPENEEKLNELQQQIENLEEKYYEDNVRDSHKARRIAEQGIDMSEIMKSISEYRISGIKNMDENNFNILNAQVARKNQYLEQKLAFLQKYKDISGNAERIAEIESQIETMQDSWIVAQEGYNNMDGILQTAESRKNEIQKRLTLAQEEFKTIDPMSRAYLQKRNGIENLTNEVARYERYIDRMKQTKTEIESGENPSFMGEHHRNRLQREEQERVETKRGKIQDLEGQIAELQEHIEIPENEQKIIDLQAQIDEIEATITSDRGNHKRVILQEQGRDTEMIMTDIDNIIVRFNDPYVQGKAERIDTEIKTRVTYLENKMNYLQQHLDIAGNKERVAELQSQIEQLEDKWELCTQGFGSKEQIEQRMRVTKAHLHTTLMSFKENKELKLTPEQMQEYWDKIQNGEEVPELFGKHHRERVEREKEARIKAEQQERNMLEQEYGIIGIEDGETLQRRLEEIVSRGIFLGADKASEKKVAEFEKMKQVIPRFEEFKNVYLQLRQSGLENELYANMDFQNVSFEDLLERATTILEERARAEKQNTEIEQPETTIEEEQPETTIEEEQPETIIEEEQPEIEPEPEPEQVVLETREDEPSVLEETIGETATEVETNIEIDDDRMIEAHLEYMRNHQTEQTSQLVEDYWNEIHSQQANPSVDLWMNRFNGWYSAIARVSQNVKSQFVKMKSDIIKAISEKLKERTNNKQENIYGQDTNER